MSVQLIENIIARGVTEHNKSNNTAQYVKYSRNDGTINLEYEGKKYKVTIEAIPEIIDTRHVSNPEWHARQTQSILAVNYGYTSVVIEIENGYRLIASDNRAIDFLSV